MGDQRRSDSDRAQRTQDHDDDQRRHRDEEDARFDPAHAQTQHAYHKKSSVVDQPTVPKHIVEVQGRVDTLEQRYDAAKAAKNATEIVAAVREMGSQQRKDVAKDLTDLATFMSARDIIHVGGLIGTSLDVTLLAAFEAKPALTLQQARAFLLDVSAERLGEGFWSRDLIAKLKTLGPVTEVLPQIAEQGVLTYVTVAEWLIDTAPPKVAARLLVNVSDEDAKVIAASLDYLGPKGWKWLASVDAQMAKTAPAAVLAAYRDHAKTQAEEADPKRTIDDTKNAAELERWTQVAEAEERRSPAAKRGDAAWLRAHRKDVIEKSSLPELQQQMEHAGISTAEQLDWFLDKPGIKPKQLREATVLMSTDSIEMSSALIAKLQARFPKTPVEELFTGDVPSSLIAHGAQHAAVAKWMLAGAQPEAILRFVTRSPALIDEWCTMLVTAGIGFGWVRELGGFYNDALLRRFVIKCPDQPTREFIQQRILGEGHQAGDSMVKGVSPPTAHTSNRSHLDADLDRNKGRKSDQASDTIAADVNELMPAEIDGLRRDATRLKQVLASANKKTFAQILEQVNPTLQVALMYANLELIDKAQFVAWAQTRPGHEVSATLSDEGHVARVQKLTPKLGPFELFTAFAAPDVLGPVLKKNPAIMDWIVMSDATKALPAFTASGVIDAAARALAQYDAEVLDEWMPSAAALGGIGKTVYVQLHARAKGALRDVLDAKLQAKLPSKDDEAPERTTDQDAVTLLEPGAFVARAQTLIAHEAWASLLSLCRSEPGAWKEVATDPALQATLKTQLDLSPDVMFGVPLATLLAHSGLHEWIFQMTTPLRVLGAITPAVDAPIAKTFDDRFTLRQNFFAALPRGRGFTAPQKQTLHRIAKLVSEDLHAALFMITYDVELDNENTTFSRAELDKIWSVLELVPHAHVDQRSISKFKGTVGRGENGTPGVYYPDDKHIELQTGQIGKKDAEQYDLKNPMTEAQAIEAVGSKADLTRFVAEGRIVEKNGMFEWKHIENLEIFPHVILHEIGHAVDYMLGAKTELIYDLVGWKRFHTTDFDDWAKSLGGWDSVLEPDRKQIRDVWISWLHAGGSGTVAGLVDPEHPAVAKKYAHVGVVKAASITFSGLPMAVDNVWVNRGQRHFITLSMKGYNATPSVYALTAPEEYFAECYANYYREYDGTPATAAKKGQNLAPWIKGWFDTHIDNIGHNPIRHGRD